MPKDNVKYGIYEVTDPGFIKHLKDGKRDGVLDNSFSYYLYKIKKEDGIEQDYFDCSEIFNDKDISCKIYTIDPNKKECYKKYIKGLYDIDKNSYVGKKLEYTYVFIFFEKQNKLFILNEIYENKKVYYKNFFQIVDTQDFNKFAEIANESFNGELSGDNLYINEKITIFFSNKGIVYCGKPYFKDFDIERNQTLAMFLYLIYNYQNFESMITETISKSNIFNQENDNKIIDMLRARNELLNFKIRSLNAIKNLNKMFEFYKNLNQKFAISNKLDGVMSLVKEKFDIINELNKIEQEKRELDRVEREKEEVKQREKDLKLQAERDKKLNKTISVWSLRIAILALILGLGGAFMDWKDVYCFFNDSNKTEAEICQKNKQG